MTRRRYSRAAIGGDAGGGGGACKSAEGQRPARSSFLALVMQARLSPAFWVGVVVHRPSTTGRSPAHPQRVYCV